MVFGRATRPFPPQILFPSDGIYHPRISALAQICLRIFVRMIWTKNSVMLKMVSLRRSSLGHHPFKSPESRLPVLQTFSAALFKVISSGAWAGGGSYICYLVVSKSLPGSLSSLPQRICSLLTLLPLFSHQPKPHLLAQAPKAPQR